MPYDTRSVLSASRYLLAKVKSACGANAQGGGGFQPGNTCGGGGGEMNESQGNEYSREFVSNGKPIKVQVTHGTSGDFDAFDFDYAGSGSGSGSGTSDGFFFAESDEHSEYWARNAASSSGGEAKLLDVELRVESYLEFDVEKFISSDHPQSGDPVGYAIDTARDEYEAVRFVNGADVPELGLMDWWFVFDPDAASVQGSRVLPSNGGSD